MHIHLHAELKTDWHSDRCSQEMNRELNFYFLDENIISNKNVFLLLFLMFCCFYEMERSGRFYY